ncbi:MAG: DNA gyrase subunit A, partial [Oscillospiraceae bacterium]|nr:DNA gyrase subunit A [Oscillospiraceae bacterium]
VRAKAEFEEFGKDRTRIIVTELPYQVNKRQLIKHIAEQVKEKRLEGISDLRDESDRNGMRIVIELKRDANPQVVLNRLFAQTQMQTTFGVNMLALVNNQTQPRILSLRHVIDEYLAFQQEVIERRTRFDLRKAEERAHILQGLLIAQDNIDAVIKTIRESYDDAKQNLMDRFGLDEIQAQVVLDMRLKALQGLEREKLQKEFEEIEKKIAYYKELLANEEKIRGVLKDELIEIRDKFGDERLTEIQDVEDELDIEDLIEEEQCVYTMSHAGYIKRLPASTYRAQKRGGKGITAMSTREEDYVESVFTGSTHDYILFFSNIGKVHRKKGYQIPEAGRTAKGTNIVNILPLEPGEKVTAGVMVHEFDDESYLVFFTRNGTVKRLLLKELHTARKGGIRALTLDEGDELIDVRRTGGNENVIIATHNGVAICFNEQDIRPMGRDAVGVRGIKLKEGDYVVGSGRAIPGSSLLSITENGYGKRTLVEEYFRGESGDPQKRGGSGMKAYQCTDKTGKIAGVRVVEEHEDILMITDDGTIIRTAVADINVYSRVTQGVRVMRLDEGVHVISLASADKEEDEKAAEE